MNGIIKKSRALVLCAAMLISMGCNSKTMAEPSVTTEQYEIISQTYADRGVTINYPQLTGMTDIKKQEKINAQLKGAALRPLGYFLDPGNVAIDIQYAVKLQNPNILSIVFSGTTDIKEGTHPVGQFYTANININTGKKLKLRDLVSINDNFMKNIKQGKLMASSPHVTWNNLSSSDTELKRAFNVADGDGQFDVNSYYTESSIGLNICVEHRNGDNAQLEVNYQAVLSSLKADDEIWLSILHKRKAAPM